MVGGVITEIVRREGDLVCANVQDGEDRCGIKFDAQSERIAVGDPIWWQGPWVFWTPQDRSRQDVKLLKLGPSGAAHPIVYVPDWAEPKR